MPVLFHLSVFAPIPPAAWNIFSLDTPVTPTLLHLDSSSQILPSHRATLPSVTSSPLYPVLLARLHRDWFLFFLSTCHHLTFYIYIHVHIYIIYTIYILYTHLLFTCLLLSTLLECRLQEGKDFLSFSFHWRIQIASSNAWYTEMLNKFFSMVFGGKGYFNWSVIDNKYFFEWMDEYCPCPGNVV